MIVDRQWRWRVILPILVVIQPLQALADDAAGSAPAKLAWPTRMREQMTRLNGVEWQLRNAAGDLCQSRSAAFGMTFDNLAAYRPSDQALVGAMLHLGWELQVAAVARNSPAADAGIMAGDTVVEIDGERTDALLRASDDPALFSEKLTDRLSARVARSTLRLIVRRGGELTARELTPRMLCAAPFVYKAAGAVDAYSDGRRLAITSGLIEFTANDDELALLAGHELAHVIHGDDKADNLWDRRRKERDADALGAALAKCAGFDPALGVNFWRRYRQRDWAHWLRDRTHDTISGRISTIEGVRTSICPLGRDNAPPGYRAEPPQGVRPDNDQVRPTDE